MFFVYKTSHFVVLCVWSLGRRPLITK